ncbi:hypothetical protein O3U67_14940 [Brevundimonas diminuta]|uniref:hypothetical protein n=1 Tax=Brevundimonas diminuta TaxID=293 RepID=UPI0022AFB52B|nr:hypothetical protein [Brevundimonas diminuta]MCZ4109388.1 hypothetical protein [Brevundimonas diminuta]
MIRASNKLLTALLMGGSAIALATGVQAQDAAADDRQVYCGRDTDRPCGPVADDAALERRGVGSNLEAADRGAAGPFRVSIDGEGEGGDDLRADRQRRQDMALAGSDVRVQATAFDVRPVLSIVADQPVIRAGDAVRFFTLSNYAAYIDRAEVRIFRADQSVEETPLTVIPARLGEPVLWTTERDQPGEHRYRYVLRVYDAEGRYDQTSALTLDVTHAVNVAKPDIHAGPLFENMRVVDAISVKGAAVTLSGEVEDAATRVTAFGTVVPVDRTGRFMVQQIVPADTAAVAVQVARPGQAPVDLVREIVLPRTDRFFVGIADITAGSRSFDAAKHELLGDAGDHRNDFVDGRLAFYFKGVVRNDWRLTASADTGEQPLKSLFDGFLEKDPRSLLRRIDPEMHYPVYGDDSVTVEDAPTYGRFYVRAENENTDAMWGVFQSRLGGNELIRHQRTLYGANLDWRSDAVTATGERRTEVTAFAADPGTVASREDFASTGGSVYFFRNRDIAPGSERIFLEVRDKDSGLVLERQELIAARDYEVNYLQGRVIMRNPPPMTADSNSFVSQSSLAGNPVWVVAAYEYSPGLTRPEAFTTGGRAQHWLTDHLRVGGSAYHQGEDQASQDLFGADVLYQHAPNSFVKLEFAQADGPGDGSFLSSTGGYDFTRVQTEADKANAVSLTFAGQLDELGLERDGRFGGYWKTREAGFSAPGELTFGETLDQYGGVFDMALSDTVRLQAKGDVTDGRLTERHAVEVGLRRETAAGWFGSIGVRSDKQQGQRTPYSPLYVPPPSEGARTDAAVTVGYRHTPDPETPNVEQRDAPWAVWTFAQATLDHDGGRESNDRFGLGGEVQVHDRLKFKGEVSDGDMGFGADVRADFAMTDRGSLYLGYALAGENPDAMTGGRLGRLTGGARQQMGEKTSVFAEQRYDHGDGPTGWTQAYGVDFSPIEAWTFGARYETGSLADALGQEIDRMAIGATADYGGERLRWASALEYRKDEGDTVGERTTVATRNQVTYKATPSLRLFAKANISLSNSDQAMAMNADYYELALAGAYRPVDNDRLNLLTKYTYLADLPSPAQVDALGQSLDYAQRSHIAAIDGTYQVTPRLAVGAKVAWRLGELRASRDESAPWFDSEAVFWAVRADYQIVRRWDVLVEVRELSIKEAHDSRLGALVGVYRHFGDHVKLGLGYNFTDYSDDLGDLSYDERGWFVNLIGKF